MAQYSQTAMDHFQHPRNVGPLEAPDGRGQQGEPGRGNFMVIEVAIQDGTVTRIGFQTYGCPGAVCCGSMVTELAMGATVDEAHRLTADDVLEALGKIPLGKRHAAGLAIGALRRALHSALDSDSARSSVSETAGDPDD